MDERECEDLMQLIDHLRDRIVAFLVWIYDWITVLAGITTGALAFLPDLLDVLIGINLTDLGISPSTAAAITSAVALAKGLIAFYRNIRAA